MAPSAKDMCTVEEEKGLESIELDVVENPSYQQTEVGSSVLIDV